MADVEPDKLRSRRWIVFVVVPVFYVLSYGPTAWARLALKGRISASAYEMIFAAWSFVYAPLDWCGKQMAWLERWLDWYWCLGN